MLTGAELKMLLAAGAKEDLEILPARATTVERIARTLAALANTRGGTLLIPFSANSNELESVRDRTLQALLMIEPRLIIPLPYAICQDDGAPEALIIEVPEGLPHVYALDGRYFGREGNRSVVMSDHALRALMVARGENTWESAVPVGASYSDLDSARIEAYAQRVSPSYGSVEDLLLRRGCVVRRGRQLKPTHAGLLLFGHQPQRWVRGAELICARFSGVTMDDAFIRQTIDGTLAEQIQRAEAFLNDHLPRYATLGNWQRQEAIPYPPGVLREAIVNAVAHRDYRLTGNQIHVLIFADRVEVRSPGRLPGHMNLNNLVRERYSRNEAIVQVLADLGFIERLGYGIDRMISAMQDAGQRPPAFEEGEASFSVTLYAREVDPLALPRTQTAQQERWQKMLAYLKANGQITNREYQELCPDVNPETLRRDFADLTARGVILRIGDKRGTYYILK